MRKHIITKYQREVSSILAIGALFFAMSTSEAKAGEPWLTKSEAANYTTVKAAGFCIKYTHPDQFDCLTRKPQYTERTCSDVKTHHVGRLPNFVIWFDTKCDLRYLVKRKGFNDFYAAMYGCRFIVVQIGLWTSQAGRCLVVKKPIFMGWVRLRLPSGVWN